MGLIKSKNKVEKTGKSQNKVVEVLKYVLPILLAVIIFLIIKFLILGGTYRMTDIGLDKYKKLVSGNKQSLIFVTSNDCSTCDDTKALIKKVLQGSSIKTYEINLDKLSDSDKDTFMATFDETNNGVVAPALLLVQDNGLVNSYYGPFDEDLFIQYLQSAGLVKTE